MIFWMQSNIPLDSQRDGWGECMRTQILGVPFLSAATEDRDARADARNKVTLIVGSIRPHKFKVQEGSGNRKMCDRKCLEQSNACGPRFYKTSLVARINVQTLYHGRKAMIGRTYTVRYSRCVE
jgi:hypothetical protein